MTAYIEPHIYGDPGRGSSIDPSQEDEWVYSAEARRRARERMDEE